MSLGLSDLNKKRRRTGGKTAASVIVETKPIYARSKTARPWSGDLTSRSAAPNRPRADLSGIAVNEEWMDLQTEPIFWIDLRQHSFLLSLNERMSHIEGHVQNLVLGPLQAMKRFFKPQK